MTTKTSTIEINVCDFCTDNEENCYHKCLCCGKDVCWNCEKNGGVGVGYSHGVHVVGSNDGWYCNKCNLNTDDPLLDAYKNIDCLKREQDTWYDAFKIRKDAAEAKVKELLDR